MRKPIIVGNWKMNHGIAETKEFVAAVDGKVTDKADWGIATPFLDLATAKEGAKNLIVAAENCHFKDSGAYTGEVSVGMLKEIGVEWVILGHSERRQYFGETDETVNLKMLQVLNNGMTPIVCVGESLEEYEAGKTHDVVKTQVVAAFKDVTAEAAERVVIAYEPIWAIGTGRVATTQQAQEVCCSIRGIIRDIYGTQIADAIRILYGGSVNAGNALQLFSEPDIDGGLVGGASLKPEFSKIVNYQ